MPFSRRRQPSRNASSARRGRLDARIPYQVPTHAELPEQLDAVLRVIYLVFNEG